MAYDKTSIDAYGEFSRYIQFGRRKATTHNGEWSVRCPLPGCTSHDDALQLWPYRLPDADNNVTHFWCRKCDKHGDIVTFIALMDGVSDAAAAAKLGLVKGFTGPTKPRRINVNLDAAPSDTWMQSAMDLCKECKDILHSPTGKPAMDWLHARGLSDETIDARWYGYNPCDRWDDLSKWDVYDGKKIWIPRGITIPWTVGNELWKINIRRGVKDMEKDVKAGYKPRKYVPVKGGSNALYRINSIRTGQPLVILEGEFDADLLSQLLAQTGITDVATVATGSTDKGRADNWLVRIAKATPILFSFDPDDGGVAAVSEYWSKVLPSGTVWPGVGGDITEMYQSGRDVVKWFKKGLKIATLPIADTTPAPATPAHVDSAQEEDDRHFKPWPAHLDKKLPCYRCGGNILKYAERLETWMCLCYFDMQDALEMRHFKPKGEWAEPVISKCCRCDKPALIRNGKVSPYCVDCSPVQVHPTSEEVSA